jgi:branched-chain amino acid transport system substrate-binding protein
MKRLGKYFLLLVLFMSVFSVMVYALNAKPEQRPDIIKIGAIGPLEITPGQDMEKGAMLAVEEINAGDGVTVGGTVHDIELIVETTFDTTLGIPDPTQGSISLTKLLDSDNVAAVVGGFRTEVVMALQASLDRPMLGVGATAPIINPFFWRLGPSNGTELTRNLVDFYAFGLTGAPYGVRNVTIIREDAAWSLAMSIGLKFYLQELLPGNTPYSTQKAPQVNFTDDIVIDPTATLDSVTTSMSVIGSTLDGLDVNAIMHVFSGPVGRKVTQAWHALDLPQFLAGINVESQASTFFNELNGGSYGEMELETAPPDISQTNKTDIFRAAYLARYDEQPTYTAFASYDSIYVLKEAMENANSLVAADIQTALGDTHYTGTAYEIKFTNEDNVWTHPIFGYPYGQVGYFPNNGSRFVIVPGQEDLIVHDLYTTGDVGVRGQPFIQGYFAQWQYGGVKKTVWGKGPTVVDDIGNLSIDMEWPIDHSDTGYVPTTTTTTTTDTGPIVTTTTTTTTTTTVTDIPGFGVSLAFFVLICVVSISYKRRRNKR